LAKLSVHHLALAGPLGGTLPIEPVPALDVGETLPLARGPNLYLSALPGTPPAPRPVQAPGIAHLCVQAHDGAAVRASLEGDGAAFLSPPVALGTGYLYAYGHDACGRLFELETAEFLPTSPPAWFGHVAYVTTDGERLAAFYGALLDAPVEAGARFRGRRFDQVAGLEGLDLEGWWVRADTFTLEVWRYHAPPAPAVDSAAWYPHLGLETNDLEAALTRVEMLGGRGGEVRTGPDGRSARAWDPDGNGLLLVELAGQAQDRSVAALGHRDVLQRVADARSTQS
jgi:catechol 2,3-dioxygenase-like lactoylglutathione lyase family enzyme